MILLLIVAAHLFAQNFPVRDTTSRGESTVVAKVLGQEIQLDDLVGWDDDCCRLMAGAIYGLLIDDFQRRNTFEIAEWEIDAFQRFTDPDLKRSRSKYRNMAIESLKRWKTYQMLVETYGGEIHFQQADPLEPVGAIRAFLEEEQRLGRFEILSAYDENRFWSFYRARFPYRIKDPVKAYQKPWWSYSKEEFERLVAEN